jgi:transposase
VLIDHSNQRVLEVLDSREKTAVVAWLSKARDSGLLGQLQEVTTDMWDGYVEAAKAVLGPGVRIVIDRFHVMKLFQEWLTDARREIQRGLSKEQAQALKGSRWLWVTNQQNLTRDQLKELARLGRQFPQLRQLRRLRDGLRRIFENPALATAEAGKAKLRAWCQQAQCLRLKALEKFGQTMDRWMDLIANYFVSRSSNGRTEGFNHGIRALLWRAFGMQNFAHFRLRVLHVFG